MSFILRAPPPPGSFAPTSTMTAAASSPTDAPHDGECRLLGPFAIIIQSALGALALLSLVYKRYRERPQRPVKIWAFDASKQVVGSILLHLVNLAMSELSSGAFEVVAAATKGAQGVVDLAAAPAAGENGGMAPTGEQREGMGMLAIRGLLALSSNTLAARHDGTEDSGSVVATKMPESAHNPCSFYLLNLAIDTTIGIPILIVLLRLSTAAFARTPLARPRESIKSGNYGQPPRTTWWLKQCLIYFIGLLGMKLCVFFIFQMCPWLGAVGDWALRWTEGDERLQIFFVMLFFPLVMNAMQYYIIDGFIKDQKTDGKEDGSNSAAGSYEEIGQEDVDDADEEEDALGSGEGAVDIEERHRRAGDGDAEEARRSGRKVPGEVRASRLDVDGEYDPELHGQK